MWKLRVEGGPRGGNSFSFDRPDRFLVGRAIDAHLRLPEDDPFVSRNHCLIEVYPPRLILTDLNSKNGTLVNGRKTHQSGIKTGDQIRIGQTTLVAEHEEQREEAQHPIIVPTPSSEAERKHQVQIRTPAPRARCSACQMELQNWPKQGPPSLKQAAVYLCSSCAARSELWDRVEKFGRYSLLREIGRGGMGIVYQAWDEWTGGVVALKILHPDASDERSRRMFQREMSVMTELHHPNIVRLYEQGCNNGQQYLVSEWLEGGDLENLVTNTRRAPLFPTEAVPLLHHALQGLRYAHEHGFVHRDIKPTNLLLGRSAGPNSPLITKLCDFGLAKSFIEAGASLMTCKGEAAGTAVYMAPEQITNYRFVKPPADIYSLGVTSYFLLTGRLPFDLTSPLERALGMAVGEKHKDQLLVVLEDDPIPIQKREQRIPDALATVIDRAVRKKEQERFRTAGEMQYALEEAVPDCFLYRTKDGSEL